MDDSIKMSRPPKLFCKFNTILIKKRKLKSHRTGLVDTKIHMEDKYSKIAGKREEEKLRG